jgi:hypothetical protein
MHMVNPNKHISLIHMHHNDHLWKETRFEKELPNLLPQNE